VPESDRLVSHVQTRLDDFLTTQAAGLRAISPDLVPIHEFSSDLLRGGKRFRAQFCYWGWRSVIDLEASPAGRPQGEERPGYRAVVGVAAGLEIFHAAALVHDDIIDRSDTRRGRPAAHRRLEQLHAASGWGGSSAGFGEAGAILLGDLLLGWSDELLIDSLLALADGSAARAARAELATMRTQVTLGQYLDVLEEVAWPTVPEDDTLARAHNVIVYKSAKYSIEAPLVVGASLAGASAEQVAALRAVGLPLGIAFQLRDDVLGVFGDSAVTGKPSGDDLREGKRTVLIALARRRLPDGVRRTVDALLGDPGLDDEQIRALQSILRESGALDEVEGMIARHVRESLTALREAPIGARARNQLELLVDGVTRRVT
jgi:geranylgeranyl diphosphate synthase type I